MAANSDLLRAEDERTRDLSASDQHHFDNFPLVPLFHGPNSHVSSLTSLHDYTVAMSQLDLQANDLILDFGCGPGWVSEFAARQGLRSVGVDCSEGTLRVGRERAARAGVSERAHFVKADVQRLPFKTGSFQAVVCIAALHHIENMGQAIAEMHRILAPQGEAILIEPGRGHSQVDDSRMAVEEHGTLEQDVVAEDVAEWAKKAGFADFQVVPQYFTETKLRWDLRDWLQQRALRTGSAVPRGRSRFWDLARLFRAWWLGASWRVIARRQVTNRYHFQKQLEYWLVVHGAFLLRKSLKPRLFGSLWAEGLAGTLCVAHVEQLEGGVRAVLEVRNTGQALWKCRTWREVGQVKVGVIRMDTENRVLDRDFRRFPLPRDVEPGKKITIRVEFDAPSGVESARWRFDLVSEQLKWFEAKTPEGSLPEAEWKAPAAALIS